VTNLRLALLLGAGVACEGAAFVLLTVVVLLSHLDGNAPAVDGRGAVLLVIAGVLAALPLAVVGLRARRRGPMLGALPLAAAVAGLGYALAVFL
jgi:hypothetical protein